MLTFFLWCSALILFLCVLLILIVYCCLLYVGSSENLRIYFDIIWGVWNERCCVHKYRCYYWNINNCLLGIINKTRSRILVYVISQRYLSYGWYLQSAWCFKNCKPHPSGMLGRPKRTNPNIWNGHNGAVSLLTYTHFIDILLLDVGVQRNTWLSKTWCVITVLKEKSTLGYIKD